MAVTPVGNPYVESSDNVADFPGASEALAERIDIVGVNPFANAAARTTAIPSPVEGQMSSLADTDSVERYNGSAWVTLSSPTSVFAEEQASGTNGGLSTIGAWTKRTLNTTRANDIPGVSIASSVISLPAGTYYVEASSQLYRCNQCQIKIRNSTDSTDLVLGTNNYFNNTNGSGQATLFGTFTLAAAKDIELQYRLQVAAVTGLGTASSWGTEVYSILAISKVG